MLNQFLRLLIRSLLWLRYRIRVKGLDRVAPPDGRGFCSWPTTGAHRSIMVMAVLWPRFRPRVLADRAQAGAGDSLHGSTGRALEIADMTRCRGAASRWNP